MPSLIVDPKEIFEQKVDEKKQLLGADTTKFLASMKQADFERFKDSEVKIKTSSVIDGQKNFKGTLMGAAPGVVKLKVNGKVVQIPFQEIVRARLNPS